MHRALAVALALLACTGCFPTEFQALDGHWEGACVGYQGDVLPIVLDLVIADGNGSGTCEVTVDHVVAINSLTIAQEEEAAAICDNTEAPDYAIDALLDDPDATDDAWLSLCVSYPDYERGVLRGLCDVDVWSEEGVHSTISGDAQLYQE